MASQWHVGRGGQTSGPYSSDQLRDLVAKGELSPGDLVWKEGMAEWVDCSTVQGLFPATRVSTGSASSPDWNPYQSPTADVGNAANGSAPSRIVYADYLPRVGALILDSIFLSLLTFIPAFGIGIAAVMLAGPDAGQALAQVIANLFGFLAGIAYYVGLETSEKQGTWGKQIVGIKVTDMNGRRLTFGRAIGRYFAKILSGCTFGIGWLMPLFTEKKQTLHDMIAGCLVLKR
jgi:uncharacterized RDD family membrane protein YckC